MISINDEMIRRIAVMIVGRIQERTSKGIDMHGKPFEPYSSRTFAMPYGAFLQYFSFGAKDPENTAGIRRYNKLGTGYSLFKTKSGAIWALVEGGYLNMKKARFKTGETRVNLQVRGMRGGMMGDLQILSIEKLGDDKREIVIGFRNAEAAKLAMYHQLLGAGKRKVLRQFLGITPQEMNDIAEEVAQGIKITV